MSDELSSDKAESIVNKCKERTSSCDKKSLYMLCLDRVAFPASIP